MADGDASQGVGAEDQPQESLLNNESDIDNDDDADEPEGWKLWALVGGVAWVACVVLVVVGVDHLRHQVPPQRLVGSVAVDLSGPQGTLGYTALSQTTGTACVAGTGYDDVSKGGSVTVTDESEKVIALGTLSAGSVLTNSTTGASYCTFSFSVEKLPKAKFYGVAVGHRNTLRYSRADLQNSHFEVTLTLGEG